MSDTRLRYAFKHNRELTADDMDTLRKLELDIKEENKKRLMRGVYGEVSFDKRLFSFKEDYDDDYLFIYFELNQKTGEVKLKHHGDIKLREMELVVSEPLERRIISFLRSITRSRAFSMRKHALASRKIFLNTLHNGAAKSPAKSHNSAAKSPAKSKTRRNRR